MTDDSTCASAYSATDSSTYGCVSCELTNDAANKRTTTSTN